MNLVGMMPIRNEAWCLGLTLRAALMWLDSIVVLDHASADDTPDIISDVFREHPSRVCRISVDGDSWEEMSHRQMMLEAARRLKATHCAIVDADEILTSNMLCPKTLMNSRIGARSAGNMPAGWKLELPGYNLRGGIDKYHADGVWGNRLFTVAFRDEPMLHWQGRGYHHREPMGRALRSFAPVRQGEGGVMHLWGVSERRLKAKHALYKVNERLRFPEKPAAKIDEEYSWAINGGFGWYGTPKTWTYSKVPESWWAPYAHLMKYLVVDAEPWQESEVRRIVAEHSKPHFAGLDLFEVA